MTILPVVNEQLVQEKVELDTRGVYWNILLRNAAATAFSERAPFKIKRNLGDDTFNLEVHPSVRIGDQYSNEIPYINVNNEYEVSGYDSSLNRKGDQILSQSYSWVGHHSLFKDLKFHDASVIALGTDVQTGGNGTTQMFYRNIIYPHFGYVKNQINASYKDVIHFRTIKSISGNQSPQHDMNVFGQSPQRIHQNGELNLSYEYNDVYIRPIEPSLGTTDKRIAEVYVSNTDNSTYKYDYNITHGILRTSSLAHDQLETYFESTSEEQTYNNAKLVGYIAVADPTYYDYDKKETKVGYSSGSREGDTVPYNYKGDFTRSITLGINGVFDKVTISFSKRIEAPLLDPYEGKVRLYLSYSEQPLHDVPPRFLDEDSIKKIREHYYSLKGINRLSKVYEV